jgi:hypothetical protein
VTRAERIADLIERCEWFARLLATQPEDATGCREWASRGLLLTTRTLTEELAHTDGDPIVSRPRRRSWLAKLFAPRLRRRPRNPFRTTKLRRCPKGFGG